MIRYYIGISSATSIEILPDESMSIGKKILISQQRTAAGYMYENKICHYDFLSIPLEYVPSSLASIVNSWWLMQVPLQFIIAGDAVAGSNLLTYQLERYYPALYYPGGYWPRWQAQSEVFSCFISSDDAPLKSMSLPYDNRFKGTIKLEGY
jgi:hypothetical protein